MTDATYPIYTKEFDRIVSARTLASEVAPNLPDRYVVTETSDGVERTGLRADSDTVAGLVAFELPDSEATVQILLDMSGSNRGQHVEIIGLVDLMARALEKAGVPFEVLGYTTGGWKGGRVMEKWREIPHKERPRDIGRCNELLHVVFKEPGEPWSAVGPDGLSPALLLDGLYRPPHLKENIDGEALRWALGRRGDGEASLVFLNDGRSVDDATMSLNRADILETDKAVALDEVRAAGVRLTVAEIVRGTGRDDRSPWSADESIQVHPGDGLANSAVKILAAALAPEAAPAPGR